MGDGKLCPYRFPITEKVRKYAKNRKKAILSVLIIISGFFYLAQIFGFLDLRPKKAAGEVVRDSFSQEAGKCYFQEMLKNDGNAILGLNDKNCSQLVDGFNKKSRSQEEEKLESDLYQMVGNYPIRDMVPTISQFDRRIAAFIVGIARKESSWGEHVPTLNGQDCFNYWGFKGQGSRGMAMGYGCFATPEEGARAVGDRISRLMSQKLDTPSEMVVWKCGSTCAGHDPKSVTKWISDVALFYNKITKAS